MDTNEKVLTIIRGEEFKLSLKDKIDENDIFYDQYLNAAGMLDDIVAVNENNERVSDWRKIEAENNIIAFCGERGEGKSSAMMTFINALVKQDSWRSDSVFRTCENVKNTVFSRPVIIDPSAFDNMHNILEVIVANLYSEYWTKYKKDSSKFEDDKCGRLLRQFQKVYRIISLLNNPDKMMEEEYDGEANISNLAKMGESTKLKRELKNLIKIYLDYMMEERDSENKKLLIAIDDLDLCNANAYKMAEQIRKYLIIPDVVIVMAVKVEQLQMCVQEENFRNYRNVLSNGEKPSEFYEEVRNMAEKYIAKLIPRSRRIYLPNVRYIYNARIQYLDRQGRTIYEEKFANSLNGSLLNMICAKTGMRFILKANGTSWLQANNLRDAVNMITLLGNMPDPRDNKDLLDNIEIFSQYIEKEWIPQNFAMDESRELQSLTKLPYFQMNSEALYLLRDRYDSTRKKYTLSAQNYNMENSSAFFWIRRWMDNYRDTVYDREAEKFAYVFHILYTIYFNEILRQGRYRELSIFLGGYVWGNDFDVMFPNAVYGNSWLNRSRFPLPVTVIYNTMAEKIGKIFDTENEKLKENSGRISKITENDPQREYKIFTWFLLGMLSNTYRTENQNPMLSTTTLTFSSNAVIYSNYTLIRSLHICMENYLIGLSNLGQIYYNTNMDMLGISWEEYMDFFMRIERNNRSKIDMILSVFCNVDFISEFYEYCKNNRDVKEGGEKDDHGKTVAVVDRFFRNAEHFCQDFLGYHVEGRLNELILENKEGKRRVLNISELYADLFIEYYRECMNTNNKGQAEERKEIENINKKNEMMRQLNEMLLIPELTDVQKLSVSGYLINRSAQNIKNNLDNLVHNIRRYYGIHPNENILKLDTEKLKEYYSRILDYYIRNPKLEVAKTLSEGYKQVVKQYTELIRE